MEHLLAVLGLAAGCVIWGSLMARRARDKAEIGITSAGCGGCTDCERAQPQAKSLE